MGMNLKSIDRSSFEHFDLVSFSLDIFVSIRFANSNFKIAIKSNRKRYDLFIDIVRHDSICEYGDRLMKLLLILFYF